MEVEQDLPFTQVDGEDVTMVENITVEEKIIAVSSAGKVINDGTYCQSEEVQSEQMKDTDVTAIGNTQHLQGLSEHLAKTNEDKTDCNLLSNASQTVEVVENESSFAHQTIEQKGQLVISTSEAEINIATTSTMTQEFLLQDDNKVNEDSDKLTLPGTFMAEVGSQVIEMDLTHGNCENMEKAIQTKSLGLALLASYSDEEDSENDNLTNVDQENGSQVKVHGLTGNTISSSYREVRSSSDDESDSSSDASCLTMPVSVCNGDESDGAEDDIDVDQKPIVTSKSNMLKDLGILELAPLEDLKISVPEEECIPIGTVQQIIDCLVVVNAKKGCPAIDLDSVLFFDHGRKTLGQVFDVFGPVSEPMYMVRFNSAQHILDQGVQLGMEVFFAPRTRHTAFVFIDTLFKQRGSDASWEHDQEPPENCLDYSDDEQERQARAAHRLKKKNVDPNQPQPLPRRKRQNQHQRQQGARGGGHHHHRGQHPPPNPFYMSAPPTFSAYQPSSASPMAHNSNMWQANNSNYSSAVDRSNGSVLATPTFSPHPQFSGTAPQHYQAPPNSSYNFPPPAFSPFHSVPSTSRQDISPAAVPKNTTSVPEPPPPGV